MKLDDKGIKFLIEQEGLRLKPYFCSAGKATIAIGNTFYEDGRMVKITDPVITEKKAYSIFNNAKEIFENAINNLVKVKLTQNQFNALFSFTYNVGISAFKNSTLLKRINKNPLDRDIELQFLRWNKETDSKTGKLKVNEGLSNRRKRESSLYFS